MGSSNCSRLELRAKNAPPKQGCITNLFSEVASALVGVSAEVEGSVLVSVF